MNHITFATFNKDRAKTKEEAIKYLRQNIYQCKRNPSFVYWWGNFMSEGEFEPSGITAVRIVDEETYDYLKPFEIEDNRSRFPDLRNSVPISMYLAPWVHIDIEGDKASSLFIENKWVIVFCMDIDPQPEIDPKMGDKP